MKHVEMSDRPNTRRFDMLRKTLAILIAIIWVGALVATPAQAGKGNQKRSAKKTQTAETQKGTEKGVCPLGNTPGTRQGQGKAKGNGPGDGTGNDGTGPKDGTGNGAVKNGTGQNNNPDCDGTGPKGTAKKKGQPG
jgi:hypothetical protein